MQRVSAPQRLGDEQRGRRGRSLHAQSGHALLTTMIAAACLLPLGAFAAMQARLNFLVQEMNREVNTVGSKSNSAEIAHLVVGMKEEIEKIREQLQNIE